MAVTIERAMEGGIGVHGCCIHDADVGFKGGIHPIIGLAIVNHFHVRGPVGAVTDDEYRILLGGITVSNRHSASIILACPCTAGIESGVEMDWCKEAILNDCRTCFIHPTDDTTISKTIRTLKTAVKPTVGYNDIAISNTAYDAAKTGFAIHGTLEGDRRDTALYRYRSFINLCDDAGSIPFTGLDGTCRMQILDSGIANIPERSKKLYAMVWHVEGQCMTITVEGAAIV